MKVRILIVGNDIHIHKLMVDILEITLNDCIIENATNVDGLFERLQKQDEEYNLIILNGRHEGTSDDNAITTVRNVYPQYIDRLIVLVDSPVNQDTIEIHDDVSYVQKPFSLDEFGDLVKQTVFEKTP